VSRYWQWLPTSFYDVIAGIIVLAGLGLMAFNIDGEVKSLTSVAIGWLFSSSMSKRNEIRRY